MRLRATVRSSTDKTKHYLSVGNDGGPFGLKLMPIAYTVEIIQEDDGFLMIRFDENQEFAGDSWFGSVDECKRQALFEFQIENADWVEA